MGWRFRKSFKVAPGGAYYDRTNPEAWFFTEEDARAAGYRPFKR